MRKIWELLRIKTTQLYQKWNTNIKKRIKFSHYIHLGSDLNSTHTQPDQGVANEGVRVHLMWLIEVYIFGLLKINTLKVLRGICMFPGGVS